MSSQLEDDTKYVKLFLVLLKGGTYVFKKHIQKILDSENTTIDICLKTHRDQLFNAFNERVINRKLWELLDPDSGQPKDVDVWDISAHAYVLLNIFDTRLNAEEKVAINKLRDRRNELAHQMDSALQEVDFLREWNWLIMVLHQLSTGLSSNDQDFVNKLIEDISAIKHPDKAIDDLKLLKIQDDLVKDVLAKQQCILERRLDELTQRLCALEEMKRNTESGLIEISARITVISSTQTAFDSAYHQLFEAAKRCLTGGHGNQEEDEVFTALNNMLTDMSKDSASIQVLEEGSVLIKSSYSTLTSLKSAFLYLTKTGCIRRLQELERALSQSVGCSVKLIGNIALESLDITLENKVKTFVLKYQYLLTKVGTSVLKKVFDHIVVPNLKVYLDKHPDRKLIFYKRHSSTTAHLLLQPRNDNTPSSDRFDITNLTELLRHVCGLCPPDDLVWVHPKPTDNRVEANITRLAICNLIILKKGVVFENETHLTAKWNELCKILEDLSSYCGFNGLQEEIDRVMTRIDDDQLQQAEENIEREKERKIDEQNLETGDLK